MNNRMLSAFTNELEKIALSPRTVYRAAQKRGVSEEYLRRLVKRQGNSRRYHASKGEKNKYNMREYARGDAANKWRPLHNERSGDAAMGEKYDLSKSHQFLDKMMKRMRKSS